MPFKDTNTGQTHYVGDGCNPPHPPLMEKETNDMATLTDIYEREGLVGIQKFISRQREEMSGLEFLAQKAKKYPTAKRISEVGASPEEITVMAMENGKTSGQAQEEVLRVFPELKELEEAFETMELVDKTICDDRITYVFKAKIYENSK